MSPTELQLGLAESAVERGDEGKSTIVFFGAHSLELAKCKLKSEAGLAMLQGTTPVGDYAAIDVSQISAVLMKLKLGS